MAMRLVRVRATVIPQRDLHSMICRAARTIMLQAQRLFKHWAGRFLLALCLLLRRLYIFASNTHVCLDVSAGHSGV